MFRTMINTVIYLQFSFDKCRCKPYFFFYISKKDVTYKCLIKDLQSSGHANDPTIFHPPKQQLAFSHKF